MEREKRKIRIFPSRWNRSLHQLSFIGLIILVFFAAGCDQNRIYEQHHELPEYTWYVDSTLRFTPQIEDTSQAYDLKINVRHTDFYKYSNIWLKVEMLGPASDRIIDERFEIMLAEKDGRWKGKCSGDICDFQATFREDFKFNRLGNYTVTLQQIMREDKLNEVVSCGWSIDTSVKEKE